MINTQRLLPERHPHKDFFVTDIFDNLPFKDDMASMGYPIFSLSKNKDLRVIQYSSNSFCISISPALQHGLPTIFDKDVLLYCASLLMKQVNEGIVPPKTLRISTHDLLKATNRHTNNNAYAYLENALERLHGVSITTNIKTNGIEQTKGFHLIESFEFIKSSFVKDRRVALEITLSDWFYNSVVGKEVLTINRDYFRLGKPLERRLYEIARKHCGSQKEWSISLESLCKKTGSQSPLPKFRFFIKEIAEINHLPDYTIQLAKNDIVTFQSRDLLDKSNEATHYTDLFDIPAISQEAIYKGAEIVKSVGTGWDYGEIRLQFQNQIMNGFKPKRVNGAFINFVKRKVAKLP